jgi:transforming growth factor-beta-induced protein
MVQTTPRRYASPRLRRAAAALLALGTLTACSSDDPVTESPARTIAQLAANTDQLSTLVAALQTANLVDALDGGGPFTVFAPVNDAFGDLPGGTVDALLANDNRPILSALLQYHVVPGTFRAAQLSDGAELVTLTGQRLAVRVEGSTVTVGGVPVVTPDVEAANGVVHLVGGVITSGLDIVQRAAVTPDLSSLVAAVQTAGLADALAGNGSGDGLTVFAPTNAAFAALGDAAPTDPAVLAQVLQLHVAAATALSSGLTDGQVIPTLVGTPLTVQIDGSQIRIVGPSNTVNVIAADIVTANGVVHLIDGVLLP